MATPDRDNLYSNDSSRAVYTRESNGTAWFVGVVVVLALLAIGYLIFSANSGTSTAVDAGAAPAVEAPAVPAAPETAPAPMTEAPVVPATDAAPATEAAPAVEAAPAAPAAEPADGAAAPAAQ
ncbi:hypothetical protein PSQ90_12835 [Devosia rhodophyticola]|uniref:Preprotein translocase subunit SecG n=1 Tax=Devosia rhodophyticola TaxID=3026423 RepID=A0ABY7YVT9_9HYPH|nr:hypothetical protein [Devosia rhodophyticola]WDR05170.1 hypothetical protein PSQ90_12835 [Devosia rhodophyticola]